MMTTVAIRPRANQYFQLELTPNSTSCQPSLPILKVSSTAVGLLIAHLSFFQQLEITVGLLLATVRDNTSDSRLKKCKPSMPVTSSS